MPGHFDLAPDEWAALRRLLDEALDLPADARAAWVDGLRAPHAGFKPRLRALLAHAAEPRLEGLLQTLPKVETIEFAGPVPADTEPSQVGPYRLLRQIGEGGMASVWLAERTDVLQRRQVALKLPHVSWRRSSSAERLAREREILATLNHPHIARLYDAGVTDEGQPYLALEYIEGERIDVHCRQHNLGLRERVQLFLQVARAVAHAHARLVVHRDLKPSNVLVGADGQARLLDFGIAKLLEQGVAEETELTREMGRALTPDYASPEQIRGDTIGTPADVYSLGVMLFELLTEQRPYRLRRDSRVALEEAILQAQPPRPSAVVADVRLRRELEGDLDTIVLKALKKEPSERYATVDAFAADVERWLNDWPVLARPDSRWYRASKFAARHRVGVAAAGAVAVAVLVGTGTALWQMNEAREQRDRAVQQGQRADATNRFLGMLLEDMGSGDRPVTLGHLLDRSTALLERTDGLDERVRAAMLYEASRRYATLNNTARELALLDRAIDGARRSGDRELLAVAQCAASITLLDRDRGESARRLAAVPGLAQAANPPTMCVRALALRQHSDGRTEAAIDTYRKAIARLPLDVARASERTAMLGELGHLHFKRDEVREGAAALEQALLWFDRAGQGETISKAVMLANHAAILGRGGQVLEASQRQRAALALMGRIHPSGRPPIGYGLHLAASLQRLGRHEEALALILADAERARAEGNLRFASSADLQAGRAFIKLGRHDEATERLASAEAGLRVNPQTNQRLLNELALSRADQMLARERPADAWTIASQVLASLGYPAKRDAPGIGSALHMAARVQLALQDGPAAEAVARDGVAAVQRFALDPSRSADVGQARLQLARALALQGRWGEARQEAQRAAVALRHGFGEDHVETRQAESLLVQPRPPGVS
jgi:serine/threonine-protein kinase